jgi:hypothetical protein
LTLLPSNEISVFVSNPDIIGGVKVEPPVVGVEAPGRAATSNSTLGGPGAGGVVVPVRPSGSSSPKK